jgi:hypothetical protein
MQNEKQTKSKYCVLIHIMVIKLSENSFANRELNLIMNLFYSFNKNQVSFNSSYYEL